MSSSNPQDSLIRSLASAVARGRTVADWARNADVAVATARGWSERSDFPQLVEKCRREHAERMVKKIAGAAAKAIEGMAANDSKKGDPKFSFEAAKAVVEKWVEVAMNLEQMKKIESLEERVRILEEGRAVHVRAMLGNSQN
jgi:hypothetical protein